MSASTLSLMRAVAEGDAQSLKVLLAQGTDVNCRNQSGQTPLMMAALLGHSAIVPLLLDAGADVRLRDNHGLSALEWSQRRGFADVTELLINALPIDPSPPDKRPNAEGDIRARSVNELGPAATAMLKAAHAKREADAVRERNAAMQPVVSAADPEQHPQPEPIEVEEITPLAPEPDSADWMMERERRFREAARQRIEEEIRKRAEQESVTPAVNKPVTPTEPPGPIPTAEPVAIENEAIASTAEPEKIYSRPAQAAAAGLTAEASSRSSPQPPAVDMAATQPVKVTAAASEPVAPGQTQPILPRPGKIDTPTPAAQATSATTELLTAAPTQPLAFSSTAESIALTTGAPRPGPSTLPLTQSRAGNLDPAAQVKRPAGILLGAEEAAVKAPSGRLFTRPVIWVLLALLIGSAFVTYLVTNQLSKRELSSRPGPVVPAPAAPAAPVATKPAPFVGGALAGAELSVPEAEYPAKVQSEGIRGAVTVLVQVNRTGGVVISAHALNGDRRLKTEAEKAARSARFSSDKLPNESKVISGTITYNFGMPRTEPSTTKPDNELPVVGGALVGAEASLPGAEYPETAKTKGVSGAVMVLVRVNRMGDVIAARALNGDTQLRTAAVRAAKKAKFSTIKLPRESLVTSGTITYNFITSKTLATAPGSSSSPPSSSASAIPAPPGPATVKADEDSPVVGGDLAGKEVNVPKADYPAEARRKGVSGKVEMLVRVNRRGQVISWRTLSGDRLLRPAALKAAKRATFSPEKLGNVESVLGTITYNFKP